VLFFVTCVALFVCYQDCVNTATAVNYLNRSAVTPIDFAVPHPAAGEDWNWSPNAPPKYPIPPSRLRLFRTSTESPVKKNLGYATVALCWFSVEEVMNDLGWKRVRDKSDDTVRLRWCELKSTINYAAFKEGWSSPSSGFCRAMLCKRGLCLHAVSVCHVREFCQNK